MSVTEQAHRARIASRTLARATRDQRSAGLAAMAQALHRSMSQVIAANAQDVQRAQQAGTSPALVDRLTLTTVRVEQMVEGLKALRALPDPLGEVTRGWTLANGVQVRQVRVPLGVVGIIYEARPNVTADAAGICLATGNAAVLRGSSSALDSNRAVVAALREGLEQAGLPADGVQLVEGGRETTTELMTARGLIDVLIPRGGAGLIETVVTGSTVPVIETGTGNCHLVVDAAADLQMALDLVLNAKTQRPSVCNALETVLVDRRVAAEFWALAAPVLAQAQVQVHGDAQTCALVPAAVPAAPDEFDGEYLSLDLAARVVDDLDQAIEHIQLYSSGHSETIVSHDLRATAEFVSRIDAAAVLVNASSRFIDGGEFGFGAEIGISTQKLHARGPMGLLEMTSTKYVLTGSGQTRI